jgi:hypothetical protein
MATTTEGLVPITRAYLARYYDKYPLAPLPDAAVDLAARLRVLSADLSDRSAVAPTTPGGRPPPPPPPLADSLSRSVIHCSLALLAAA